MPDTINELLEMSQEIKELSNHIASLKRESRKMSEGPDNDNMVKEIKMRQDQFNGEQLNCLRVDLEVTFKKTERENKSKFYAGKLVT